MKKSLAKKITLSILAGAVLMSSNVVWAAISEGTTAGTCDIAIGTASISSYDYNTAVGYNARASEEHSVALGAHTTVYGGANNSVALGYGSTAEDSNVVSVGRGGAVDGGTDAPKARSIINVTDIDDVEGFNQNYGIAGIISGQYGSYGSYVVNVNTLHEVLSEFSSTSGSGGSTPIDAYTKTQTDDAIKFKTGDVNFAGTNYIDRETNLTDATKKLDTQVMANADALETKANKADVYTKDEVYNKTEIDSMIHTSANVDGINRKLEKLGTRLEKVGAAALAALHPLDYDPDDKLTFSAGMGNYAGENAAALGAFYRPNEKFMLSLGGTMGNDENMVNLGLFIGLDKSNGFAKLSKRELIQKVNVMEAKYEQVEAENEAMKAEIAEMKAMLQELLAKK